MYAVQETLYGVQLSTVSPTKTPTKVQNRLSRGVVVDRALELAAAEGLEAVTIRRLATALDVTPMALYWHFRTKDELLDGCADRLLDAVELPADEGAWAERMHAAMDALVAAIRPHPQVAPLVGHRMLQHPSGLALTEMALAGLAEAGFTTADAAQLSWHALTTAIVLVTGDQVDDSGSSRDQREAELEEKATLIRGLPPERYPHVLAAVGDMVHCEDTERFYGLGVDLFIAGLVGLAPKRRRS
jgi:TetR/AcrR family tetracycline transcriptional repressor